MSGKLSAQHVPGKWSIWMVNANGEWVRVTSSKSEEIIMRDFRGQPRGYRYKLVTPLGTIKHERTEDESGRKFK